MCFIFSRTFSTFCIVSICFLKKVSTNIGGLSSFAWSFRCSQRQARFPYKRKSVSTCALMWRATTGTTECPSRQRSPHSLRRTRSPELDPWRLRRVGKCLSRQRLRCSFSTASDQFRREEKALESDDFVLRRIRELRSWIFNEFNRKRFESFDHVAKWLMFRCKCESFRPKFAFILIKCVFTQVRLHSLSLMDSACWLSTKGRI